MSTIKSKSLTLQAKTIISKKEYDKAISLLNQALALNSQNFEALFELGNCYKETQKYNQALTAYQQALKINSTNPDLLIGIGDVFFETKNYEQAETKYKEVLLFNLQNLLAIKKLADLYFHQKAYDKAEKNYLKFLEVKKTDIYSIINLSKINLAKNDIEKAINIVNTGLKYIPNNSYLLIALADCYFYQKKYDESLKVLNYILKKEPKNTIAIENIADIFYEKKEYAKSLEFFEKALFLTKTANLYFKTHCNYMKLDNVEKAEICLLKAIELDSNNYEYYYLLGEIQQSQCKDNRAIESFEHYLETENPNFEVFKKLGELYLKLNNFQSLKSECTEQSRLFHPNYQKAIENFQKYLKHNTDKEVLLKLANTYELTKEHLLALEVFEKYALLDENNTNISVKIAELYYLIQKYDKALEKYNLLYLESNNQDFNYKIATCYLKLEYYHKALEKLKDFYLEKNQDLDYLFDLQEAYFMSGNIVKAIEINKTILAFDLDLETKLLTLNTLGKLYLKGKLIKQAKETLLGIFELDKDNFEANYNLGEVFLLEANYKEAIFYLKKVADLKTDNLLVLYKLGYAYLEYNKEEECRNIFQNLVKNFPNSYLPYYGMGLLYFKEKNYNKANLILTKAIDEKNAGVEVYLKLVEIYSYLDMTNKVEETLEKAKEKYTNNQDILIKISKIRLAKKQYSKALEILETLHISNNKNETILSDLLTCYYYLNQINEANNIIDEIFVINQKNLQAMTYKALLLSKEGNDLKAVELIQEALSYDHKNKDVLMALAEIHENKNRFEDAIWTYQRIIATIPDDFISFKGIADNYFKLQNFQMAIKSYLIALELNPIEYEMLINLGISYVETSNLPLAINVFEDYIKKVPDDKNIYGVIAETYFKREDITKAQHFIEKYLVYNTEYAPKYLFLAGKIYHRIGNIEKTENLLRKAINNKYYDAYVLLGNLFYENKEYDKADKIFHDFLLAYPESYDARVLYSAIAYTQGNLTDREKKLYVSVIDKDAKFLDPNYLFSSKKWSKALILKLAEIIKKV